VIPDQSGHTCVVGLGWGDEGKGKIVDLLAGRFDVVVRYNGGANAGHTVQLESGSLCFHALPTGTLHPDCLSVIGPGVVLDLPAVIDEIESLRAAGVALKDNLRISDRAHLVMPYHRLEDRLGEGRLESDQRIGTTGRGIGPCYADKMRRTTAIRVTDLRDADRLGELLRSIVRHKRVVFLALYGDDGGLDPQAIRDEYLSYAERLGRCFCDTSLLLRQAAAEGKSILFEGANGTLLDVDHGSYPFVTSSNSSALGVPAGAGVPPNMVNTCLGVIKAYATRVGQGPFPSELHDETADRIRTRGQEFGSTTGRPRRCGWFDAVATRYSIALNAADQIALMHLDTLTGLERIGICVAYQDEQGPSSTFPADPNRLARVRPKLEFVPGWEANVSEIRRRADLPQAARDYLDRLEELLAVPVSIISVGPRREQTILR
jgi:adenylosuccinate synthase